MVEGVKAIIFLQEMDGKTETEAQAESSWANMTPSQQEQTLRIYHTLKSFKDKILEQKKQQKA
jgi:hypothetical protein